jgi:peptidoglycan/LPS O-acetylase OafA/YrhL
VPAARISGQPLLRIYPTYWACLVIGFLAVVCFPASTFIPSSVMPASAADWFANLGVFGLTQMTVSRILPAAWSRHTELWFYLVIGLITAMRPRATLVMLGTKLAAWRNGSEYDWA